MLKNCYYQIKSCTIINDTILKNNKPNWFLQWIKYESLGFSISKTKQAHNKFFLLQVLFSNEISPFRKLWPQ